MKEIRSHDMGDMMINIVMYVVSMLCGGGLMGFLFFRERKRKEGAMADMAAEAAEQAHARNLDTFAEEWKRLYEKKESKVTELEQKVDKLQREVSDNIKTIAALKAQVSALLAQLGASEQALGAAEYDKCVVADCDNRVPPRSGRTRRSRKRKEGGDVSAE